MGGRGSGPKPRSRSGPPRKPARHSRASGTPIDPRGPPVHRDIAQVLYPSTATGLPDIDQNNDPVFDLQDATVFYQDGKTMANLLEVALKGPFIVKGKMIIEPDTEERLAIPRCKSVHVQIPKCNIFSMGYGPLTLWAWSVGGWMEIKPAKVYRETYFNMFEAITLYWEIMAAYQEIEEKNQKRSKSFIRQALANARLDEIFYHYAKKAGDGVLLSEVEERCDKHAVFLLDQFDQEPAFDWTRTSFFHWIQKRHADTVAKLKAQKVKTAAAATLRTRTSVDIEMHETITESVKPGPAEIEPGRPSPVPVEPRPVIHSHDHTPRPAKNLPANNIPTIINLLEEIAKDANGHFNPKATLSRFTSKMYAKCKLSNDAYNIPKEILRLYAADLLQNLDPERWEGSQLWVDLEEMAKQPSEKLVYLQSIDEISDRLVRRTQRTIASEVATPPRIQDRPFAGKTPSLRLSAAKKRPLEEMDLDSDPEDSTGPGSVATSAVGISAAEPKRRGRPPKSSRTEPVQIPSNQSTEMTSESESSDESDSGIASTAKFVLRSYPLQTDKPTGPMGTWVCAQAGCEYVVRSANEAGQRKKVLEHMKLHTKHDMQLADQAREEGQRNGLPVSKLLDKIMNDAAKKPERPKRVQLGW